MLELLSPEKWAKPGGWKSNWVFRGHADATWSLTPSAWRFPHGGSAGQIPRLRSKYEQYYRPKVAAQSAGAPSTWAERTTTALAQARAENEVIIEFVNLADQLGHPVPDRDIYLRWQTAPAKAPRFSQRPVKFVPGCNSALALAQHHGIPTRALDWTQDSRFAAFFSASEVDPTQSDGRCAVFALDTFAIKKLGRECAEGSRFISYELSRATNRFLHAQQGLLLHPVQACEYYLEHGRWPELEAFVEELERRGSSPVLKKIELPWREAGELLRLLWLQGVSRAHLMPTFDNVTKALESRWRWS
jgi:hypothetical protein